MNQSFQCFSEENVGKFAIAKNSYCSVSVRVRVRVGLAQKNQTCLDNPVILSVKSYDMTD